MAGRQSDRIDLGCEVCGTRKSATSQETDMYFSRTLTTICAVLWPHGKKAHYSVEACCCSFKAACIVCHDNVAHLTRAGKSRTPAKIVSLPRLFGSVSASSSPVAMR